MFIPEDTNILTDSLSSQNEHIPDYTAFSRGIQSNSVQLATLLLMAVFQALHYTLSGQESRKFFLKMALGAAAVYVSCISSAVNLHISHVLQQQKLYYRPAYSSAQMLINVGITLLLLLAQVMAIEQRTEGFQKNNKCHKNKRTLLMFFIVSNAILSTFAIVNTTVKIQSDVLGLLYR